MVPWLPAGVIGLPFVSGLFTRGIDRFELVVEGDIDAGSDEEATGQAEQRAGGGPDAGRVLRVLECDDQSGEAAGCGSDKEPHEARVDDGLVDGLHRHDAGIGGEFGEGLHREIGEDEEQAGEHRTREGESGDEEDAW